MDYINKNGGFTIIGWYKHGEIHDQSNEIISSEVESNELGYHIFSINPKVSDVTDHDECIEKKPSQWFSDYKQFWKHHYEVHAPQGQSMYKCLQCPKSYSFQSDLTFHVRLGK